ncbi:SDR family NAD(P)-dependent oxidoreductase, partial [Streptomyces ipomoeae]
VITLPVWDDETATGVPAAVAATLTLVQALGDAGIQALLWCVTRGAVSAGGSDRVATAAQAGLWGLGRVVALEQPERWGGLVDLPAATAGAAGTPEAGSALAAGRLTGTLAERLTGILAGAAAAEDQLAVRAAGVFARRLVAAPPVTTPESAWRTDGTVLVTGGTGGLGSEVARWLAGEGVEHLLLLSRRGPGSPGAAELIEELAALGCRATVVACDVSDRVALAEVLAQIP